MASDRPPAALISENYRELQAQLHRERADYGEASEDWAPLVARIVRQNGVRALLDYGAGKQRLSAALRKLLPEPLAVDSYDPAIPDISRPPEPAEMVACIDVLEHVEPEFLDGVLDDLARVTSKVGFFTIATGPARKVLTDGRNAHLIQQPLSWWLPRLQARFRVARKSELEGGFWVLVKPLRAA
ncbi:MAG: hypothetical protein FJX35_17185 [Alphaproteobacteria bacterium]|nr:hypothetical protein [Alphaproteobacteria bacterium]